MTRRQLSRHKQRGGQSRKGNQQSLTASARLVDQLVAGQAEALAQTAIERAMAGSERSLLYCLDRVLPQRRPIDFQLPPIKNVNDAIEALRAIITAVNDGKLPTAEAAHLAHLLRSYAKVIEVNDVVARLEAVEAQLGKQQP